MNRPAAAWLAALLCAGLACAMRADAPPGSEDAPAVGAVSADPSPADVVRQDASVALEVPILGGQPLPEPLYVHYGVNPTIDTDEENLSTFGLDVDTASYTLARSYIDRGELPPEAAIRVEEFINYFHYGYQAPAEGDFTLQAEVVPSPQRPGYHVLHLGLKAREVADNARGPASLVFLVDVSGSMGNHGRLDLVRDALARLVERLQPNDTVAIVAYGSNARVVLPATAGDRKSRIRAALNELQVEDATNLQAGLRLAYGLLADPVRITTTRRVILCSDGIANLGATTAEPLVRQVSEGADAGIAISTVGIGMGSANDVVMEQLADRGNGHYAYVDRPQEAERVFVENLTGTLQIVAADAKLQVEFDRRSVARFRLVGYENRTLRREQFGSDRTDAGEIGAGHSVTALYEVQFRSRDAERFGVVRLRYERPDGRTERMTKDLPMSLVSDSLQRASPSTLVSLAVSAFAEKLRGSFWVRRLSWADILSIYELVPDAKRREPEVAELGSLIGEASRLDPRGERVESELADQRTDIDGIPVLE